MFQALYDYGMAHPDILPPAGYANRTVKYIVELSSAGKFLTVRLAADKKGESVKCPDVGGAAQGSAANILIEKGSIALQLDVPVDTADTDAKRKRKEANLAKKRLSFLNYFQEGQSSVPEFGAVLTALSDSDVLADIQADAENLGVKPADAVGFSVDGMCLWDLPSVRSWWASYTQSDGDASALDLVTGRPCVPTRLFKKLEQAAAGGGQSSGCKLVSFDKDAFASYGLAGKQGMNAPMAADTADTIMDALIYLANRGIRIGSSMKLIHWYSRDVEPEHDIVSLATSRDNDYGDDISADEHNATADKLVRSPFAGEYPEELADVEYHILMIKPEMARCTVRLYETGNYAALYRNLQAWTEDLKLVLLDGQSVSYPMKFNGLLYTLLSESEKGRQSDKFAALTSVSNALLMACFHGSRIPMAVLSRVLSNVHSSVHAGNGVPTASVRIAKLWLNREYRNEGGQIIMPDKNPGPHTIGWYCGELLALYEQIQKRTGIDRNSNILERFYTSCCRSPRMSLNRLQQLSITHFRNISSSWVKARLQSALAAVYENISTICGELPASLPPREQAEFLLGYYFQVAHMNDVFATTNTSDDTNDTNDKEDIENECN